MTAVIVPRLATDTRPFLELVKDPKLAQRAHDLFVAVLSDSFDEEERRYGKAFRERIQTDTEERRRANIMGQWFRVLRKEFHMAMARIEIELPRALRAEIDGTFYAPDPNRSSTGVQTGEETINVNDLV
jgi:hypothetical protein